MSKIKIFIDYPISDNKEFKGFNFLQVLFDFLKNQDDVGMVKEKSSPLKILDYGCGAADTGILLAKRGHRPTICDVEEGDLTDACK